MTNAERVASLKRSLDYAIQELEEHRRRRYAEDKERVTYTTTDGQTVNWIEYSRAMMEQIQMLAAELARYEIPGVDVRIT